MPNPRRQMLNGNNHSRGGRLKIKGLSELVQSANHPSPFEVVVSFLFFCGNSSSLLVRSLFMSVAFVHTSRPDHPRSKLVPSSDSRNAQYAPNHIRTADEVRRSTDRLSEGILLERRTTQRVFSLHQLLQMGVCQLAAK